MDFQVKLYHLKKLFQDSERKLLEFNESVPFQFNDPTEIYSPKLVNLMLEVGPQIEDITNQIISELGLKPEGGVPSRIKEINKKGVLSTFEIFCMLPHKLLVTPFPTKAQWWEIYNKTKHDLSKSQFDIKYNLVVDALGALAGLHRLSDVVLKIKHNRKYVLDKKHWKTYDGGPANMWARMEIYGGYESGPDFWRSSVFEIAQYFIYEDEWPNMSPETH